MNIVLEGEDAAPIQQVDDPKGLLYKVLPPYEDTTFFSLRFIDPYGDTIFNRLQMEPLLEEWQRVQADVVDPDAQRLMREVERLARRCQDEVHLYLRFQGE